MTPETLAHWIFETSGYKINYQDCKSRIENLCMKYADNDFTIQGKAKKRTRKDQEIHGLSKIPDSVLISELRQEIGKLNSLVLELEEKLSKQATKKIKQATIESLENRIKNLNKELKAYRSMKLIENGRDDDLNHWCSYSGITESNKRELISIIQSIIKETICR